MNDLWQYLLRVRPDLVLAIGVLAAILVTIHVLLRKRQVASAVGWIGLVWFAPVMGSVAYLLFGINRVQRRARKLRPSRTRPSGNPDWASPTKEDHLSPLKRGIGHITGLPILPGNTVQVYQDGDEAYPSMLAAIAEAKYSIGLSSYVFRNDTWGGRFIDALAAAQRRGVATRVLIDGIGGGWLLSPAYHQLRRQGVPAARFLHSSLPWRMPFLNLRSHKKILVLDGSVGFTGGMNIAAENVRTTHPRKLVQDTHFRVEGLVVRQLTGAFAHDWAFATNEELDGEPWFPDIPRRHGAQARVIDSGPDDDLEKVELAVLQAIACSGQSIRVMTPYFLPDERLITALSLAAMRGVAVDVVVPERSDHVFVDWATRANIRQALAAGVRIWRSPLPFRHSKIMVVDGGWCLIGSSNWDMRSFRLNFELCMEIYDRDLAVALIALIARCSQSQFTQEELDARPTLARLRDAGLRLMLPYL